MRALYAESADVEEAPDHQYVVQVAGPRQLILLSTVSTPMCSHPLAGGPVLVDNRAAHLLIMAFNTALEDLGESDNYDIALIDSDKSGFIFRYRDSGCCVAPVVGFSAKTMVPPASA